MTISIDANGFAGITAPAGYKMVRAYTPFYPASICKAKNSKQGFSVKLFIGLLPEGACSYKFYIDIPEKLKPSPLNLIYKNLGSSVESLDPKSIMLGFHDFDAY
jgi:hypothetical protein